MSRAKVLLFLGCLAGLFVAGFFLPVLAWVKAFALWVQGAGWVGAAAFFLIYVLATVLALPALPMTLVAGIIYGPVLGTLLMSPSSVAGATAAFLLGRTVLRRSVTAKLAASPRLAALDGAVAKEGWRLVALLRLSPLIPFNLLNYALGTTGIALGPYVLASFLAMLPATFLFVSAGSALGSVAGLGAKVAMPRWLLFLALGATLAVTWRVGLLARKALAKSFADSAEAP
ncbi:MAG: TVP38/TMEM64 family protein [Holophagaceae bacterium]|nr:TVP38/TMEM64 family protein [Holophagaceae bacterium]